ncbi:MAG TPA: DUF551 domain-containing protein [candidate division Zixibacteria bacterium]|nr:DUF551 domain-containing protein [candidate division Zixibacteria bacterium]
MDWIKIEDKQPHDRQWVIVTNGRKVIMAEYFKLGNTFHLKDQKIPVTHWMEFPKPPGDRK